MIWTTSQDQQRGEVVPGSLVEASLQELRHREHAGLQVEREEEDQEHDQDKGRHPLVVVDGDARVERGGRQSHEGAGRHVGREQRESNEPPRERTARKEVVVGGLGPLREVEAESHNEHDVQEDHHEVWSRKLELGHAYLW
jgi:hypothetical protein